MLNKKDFKQLAQIIKEARQDLNNGIPAEAIIDEMQGRIAEFCESHNELFDNLKFNAACYD